MKLTIILPFVLCGCETWSLTLAENVRESTAEWNVWYQEGRDDRRRGDTA